MLTPLSKIRMENKSEFTEKFSRNSDNEACKGWLAMKNGDFYEGKECTKIANPDDVKSFLSLSESKLLKEIVSKIQGLKMDGGGSSKNHFIIHGYNRALSDLKAYITEALNEE